MLNLCDTGNACWLYNSGLWRWKVGGWAAGLRILCNGFARK